MNKLNVLLHQAANSELSQIPKNNLFRSIGFDQRQARLGWVNAPSWKDIEKSLRECEPVLQAKQAFVFVGIGGSINGIKTLAAVTRCAAIHTLDSLDPKALTLLMQKIKNWDTTLVLPISKSGGTKETQQIAFTLREKYKARAKHHFFWLADQGAFTKLDELGWKGFDRHRIQVDGKSDIGGRFSSPHTLIFLLPLFIALNRDYTRMKSVYEKYVMKMPTFADSAAKIASKYHAVDKAFFNVVVKKNLVKPFTTWVTQLFQESLGSKRNKVLAKTLVTDTPEKGKFFKPIVFPFSLRPSLVELMGLMYFLQIFVAVYSYYKKINFVNQPCVEKYKKQMKEVTTDSIGSIRRVSRHTLIDEISKHLRPEHTCIEIVTYFCLDDKTQRFLNYALQRAFPQKHLFIFTGSDWNHHSFQAAYGDSTTLYVLLTKVSYEIACEDSSMRKWCVQNADILKIIGLATKISLKKKAVLLALEK